jgi:nucleotide-binding universal stress UspA family protein
VESLLATSHPAVASNGVPMTLRPSSILCPTDLSPLGNAAAAVAYALARSGSTVHLFHVVEPSVLLSPFDGTVVVMPTSVEERVEVERRANARLDALAPADAPREGIRTAAVVSHEVDVAEEVLAEAKRVDADVIVMGTHGRTGIGRLLMGSVAATVMRRSNVPVVLVRARVRA